MAWPIAEQIAWLGEFTDQLHRAIGGTVDYFTPSLPVPDNDNSYYMESKIQYGPSLYDMVGIRISGYDIGFIYLYPGSLYPGSIVWVTRAASAILDLSIVPIGDGYVSLELITDTGSIFHTIHVVSSVVCPINLEI